MSEQPQRRSWKRTSFVWFIRAVYVSLILAFVGWYSSISGCNQGHPVGKDKLEYGDFYSSQYQYHGAPFCCIYVGLAPNEAGSFRDALTHFAESFAIHKVVKHYMSYSGGTLANYMSGHVAFFVYSIPTTNIIAYYDSPNVAMLREQSLDTGEWFSAFYDFCFWPTNASRITVGGRDSVAPYTGYIHMVSYDKQYSPKDFKILAESLENAVRSNWPGRAVEAYIYEGDKH
jgi:hypothetical protein